MSRRRLSPRSTTIRAVASTGSSRPWHGWPTHGGATGDPVERLDLEENRLRAEIEAFLGRASRAGGVVLGRGGAVVLSSVPGALHVYLGGPREGRVERVMESERIDRSVAERRVSAHDRARRDYVRDFYGVDGDDPSLYHLVLDAVTLGVDGCVALIVLSSGYRSEG